MVWSTILLPLTTHYLLLTAEYIIHHTSYRYAWRPYVASLAVREADRRKGIARLLMKEAERTARRWGYRELMLEVT